MLISKGREERLGGRAGVCVEESIQSELVNLNFLHQTIQLNTTFFFFLIKTDHGKIQDPLQCDSRNDYC